MRTPSNTGHLVRVLESESRYVVALVPWSVLAIFRWMSFRNAKSSDSRFDRRNAALGDSEHLVTVSQLSGMLAEQRIANMSDNEAAKRLRGLELTEELTQRTLSSRIVPNASE